MELLIVIAIIGILAAVLVPNLISARGKANDTAALAAVRNCYTAVEANRDLVSGRYRLTATAFATGTHEELCSTMTDAAGTPLAPANNGSFSGLGARFEGGQLVFVGAQSVTGNLFYYDGNRITNTRPQ